LFMRGGYVVYSGPTAGALDYFTKIGFRLHQNENPADFMLDVIAGLIDLPGREDFSPSDLIQMWEEEARTDVSARSSLHKKTRSDFDFEGGLDGSCWISKDDSCLSARSQSYAADSPEREVPLDVMAYDNVDILASEPIAAASTPLKRNSSVLPTPRWLETLGEQFDQLDSQREGYVDSENMLDFLQSVGQKCTIEEANQIVRHFDVDGDGRIMRKDFLMRWTKNYWTREFSTALLGLFPEKENKRHIEVDVARASLSRQGGRKGLQRSVEMNRFSSQKALLGGSSARNQIFSGGRKRFVFRSSAGFLRQCYYLLQREPLKMMRTLELRVLDFGSMAIIGISYAYINRDIVDSNLDAVKQANTVAMMFVGVLSSLWATLFISREVPMVQREVSEGVSVTAIFTTLNLYNTAVDILIRSLAYSLPFFYITGYNQTFADFLLIAFGTAWSCSGIGMLMACVTDPRSAVVLSVAITFLFGAVLNGVRPGIKELQEANNPLLYWMVFPSYNRWATEALTLQEEMANPSYNLGEKIELNMFAYDKNNWLYAVLFLYISGILLRMVSFVFFYKKALE